MCAQSSKEYFGRVASRWDDMRQSFFPEAVRDTAIEISGAHSGQFAADIGAGTGLVTEGLKEHGISVVAIDQSQEMLDEMRQRLSDPVGVDYRVGDADGLPMSDAEVDHAFANMYLHHVESPARAIREMTRVIKPGGRLVITDLDSHDFDWLKVEHHDRWMGFDREDVARWFQEAGLDNVAVDSAGED